MQRRIKILWAYFRCHCYLASVGMFRGERMVEGFDGGKLKLVAAQNSGKYTRIFFDEGWTAMAAQYEWPDLIK